MRSRPAGTGLQQAKGRVRAHIRSVRDAMPPAQRAEEGRRIVEHVLELPEVLAARTVMAFWSFGSEVPTRPLLEALHGRGVRLVLPRVEGAGIAPLGYVPGDPTTATWFGAREPAPGSTRVDPGSIDVVVVPGLAFDRSGGRIGYGGGFFDRFLGGPASGALRVGIAFASQLLDEPLPGGSSDVPVQIVVTGSEVVRVS